MVNVVNNWRHKWRLTVNKDNTKVVHFRKPQQPRSQYVFENGIDKYKYSGMVLNEYLNCNITADVLVGTGGRALGTVISQFSNLINIGYTTFSKREMKQVFN